jgi:hypothetical protein
VRHCAAGCRDNLKSILGMLVVAFAALGILAFSVVLRRL